MGKISIICKNCGKKFIDYESNHRQFCCRKCHYDYFSHQFDDVKVKKCKGCGKVFRPRENRVQFCSFDCWVQHTRNEAYSCNTRKCSMCGKDFYPKQRDQRFCSKKCGYIWYSEFKQTDEQIQLQTEKILRTINNGRMKKAYTKPHVIIDNVLDHLCINRIDEYNIKYYSIDIYLPDSGLMIEIMGDYWHTNPTTKYVNSNSVAQQETRARDKRKHTYVKNQYSVEILYLWESDIEYDNDVCVELIKKYIDSGGVLQDYNSYNYEITQEGLVLKTNIIQPLFLCDKVSET